MEGKKSLQKYLALPVEEYSTNVLKAKSIQRIGKNLFEVELETATVLSYTVTPVIKVTVQIKDGFLVFEAVSARIKSTNKELEKYTENNKIKGFMKLNQKQFQDGTYMVAQAEFEITTDIPKFLGLRTVFENSGNLVVKASLEGTVRYFLSTLEKDY